MTYTVLILPYWDIQIPLEESIGNQTVLKHFLSLFSYLSLSYLSFSSSSSTSTYPSSFSSASSSSDFQVPQSTSIRESVRPSEKPILRQSVDKTVFVYIAGA